MPTLLHHQQSFYTRVALNSQNDVLWSILMTQATVNVRALIVEQYGYLIATFRPVDFFCAILLCTHTF